MPLLVFPLTPPGSQLTGRSAADAGSLCITRLHVWTGTRGPARRLTQPALVSSAYTVNIFQRSVWGCQAEELLVGCHLTET